MLTASLVSLDKLLSHSFVFSVREGVASICLRRRIFREANDGIYLYKGMGCGGRKERAGFL